MGIVKMEGGFALVIGPTATRYAREEGNVRAEVTEEGVGRYVGRLTSEGRPIGSFATRTLEAATKNADYWLDSFKAARAVRAAEVA